MKMRLLFLLITVSLVNTDAFSAKGRWTYSGEAYLWFLNLQGDVGRATITPTFEDIFSELDGGGEIALEANKNESSLILDVSTTYLSKKTGARNAVEIEQDNLIFTGLWGYELINDVPFDLLVGLRGWFADTSVSNEGAVESDWFDMMVGARGSLPCTERVSLDLEGLVGGGDSDLNWEVHAILSTKFKEMFSWKLGYRMIGIDASDYTSNIDTVQYGWLVGLGFEY